jgi:hypothetical protein
MNERIKLLAEQAGYSKDMFGVGHWDMPECRKFAELIVRECIQELEISRKCDPYTGDLFDCEYNTCIKEQSIMLKEHFGVEE